jgi:hypothetical protein
MSWFHALSGGNTWSAARMRSASGVSNITGAVIAGIAGRGGLDCGATSKGVSRTTCAFPTASVISARAR